MASHSSSVGEELPTTFQYESLAGSIAVEMTRIRRTIEELAEGDESPEVIEAKVKAYRLVAQLLDMERKAAGDMHRMGRERELPELADRMEKVVARARERKGRLAGDAEGDEN
jgi:hypothetical protein